MTQSTASDPWAAAAVNTGASQAGTAGGGQGGNTGASQAGTAGGGQGGNVAASSPRADAFRALDPNANPFATPDSIGGGGGVRGPGWVDLLDRLVVLEPVEKLLDQPVPQQPGQTQEFYKVNLTVLDGGKLTVVTPARAAEGDKPALPEQINEYDVPFTFPNWYAFGKAITVKLDALTLPLMLGVVKRCPTGPGYRAGKTWQHSTNEWNEYVKKLQTDPARAGSKPQFSWGLIDPTPEQQQMAIAWWQAKTTTPASS